jgi:uncharacterized protein (DUF2237 family)
MDDLLEKLKNMSGLEIINYKIGYYNYSICKSAFFDGGYTVVCALKNITEHFLNAERVVEFIKSRLSKSERQFLIEKGELK